MKKYLLLILYIFSFSISTNAQRYKWITGGGGNTDMNPAQSQWWEGVSEMCTDANRNLYVASIVGDYAIQADTFYRVSAHDLSSTGYSIPHILLASYDCNGKMRWGKLLEGYYTALSTGIQYDDAGNIYCVGNMYGPDKYVDDSLIPAPANHSAFLVKYDTSGNFKWIRFTEGDFLESTMAIDPKGVIHYFSHFKSGIVITPTVTSKAGLYDVKFDTSGNILNAIRMPADTPAYFYGVAIDKKTGIIYGSVFDNNAAGRSIALYIAAFDTSDNQKWADTISAFGGLGDLKYDQNGGVYTVSYGGAAYKKDTFKSDFTIYKFDTAGNFKWNYNMGMPITYYYQAYLITVLPNGQVASFGNSPKLPIGTGDDPYLTIVDSSGKLVFANQLHGDNLYVEGTAITSDNANNIYVGGQVPDSIYAGNLSAYHTNGGQTDFYIAKYGYNCNCTATTEPTPNFTTTGSGAVTFTYSGTSSTDSVRWHFSDGTTSTLLNPVHHFHDTGEHQVCLTVYACDSSTSCQYVHTTLAVPNVATLPDLNVYPNPMFDVVTIEHAEKGMAIRIVNMMGQQVYNGQINNDREVINISHFSNGTYLIELMGKDGKAGHVTIVKQ